MEDVTFKIYRLDLASGKISETSKEFESSLDAKDKCFELNTNNIGIYNKNDIKYFYFYAYYMDFASFRSQEDLQVFALEKLEAWNDDLNRLKALYMVATKSLLKEGLKEEEAV